MQIDQLFRKRIGYSEGKKIRFADLPELLKKVALTIPFENLCIIRGARLPLTNESLVEKILKKNEGGLCYELNPLLYMFLRENDFHVSLVRGVVYNQNAQEWSSTGRTHAAILLEEAECKYLVDTGFGGNLPLVPVPLSGETVQSMTGEFRVTKTENSFGDYLFEMKRKDKDDDWTVGYVFDSKETVTELAKLEEMQTIIIESEASSFNKGPLITKLTEEGSMTLTDKSFTRWRKGRMTKEDISEESFKELAKEHFGLDA